MIAAENPYDLLDELYDGWVASVVDDVPFYVALADEVAAARGAPSIDVLELGAGTGRISLPLAHEGHSVIAVDSSARLLDRLSHPSVSTVLGDIRQLPSVHADLVVAPFRSLLHVVPDIDSVLEGVRAVLDPGDTLAFDVFHPGPDGARATHGRWLPRTRVESPECTWMISERATYAESLLTARTTGHIDDFRMRVEVRCEPVRSGGANASTPRTTRRIATLDLHAPPPQFWRDALERSGFVIESVFGWFDERAFEPDDEDSVWVATL